MVKIKSLSSDLYNSAVVAYSISAAFSLGLFEELNNNSEINVESYCQKLNLHFSSLDSIIFALACFDIISQNEKTIRKGSNFAQIYKDKGYFLWLSGGYGNFLQAMARIVKTDNRKDNFINRNGDYIAQAGQDYGNHYVDCYVNEILNDISFKCLVDLGCGSAERLCKLAKQKKIFEGIGVEINPHAIEFANKKISTENLTRQITIIQGDVTNLQPNDNFKKAEVITSFFMGHDLWPKENCLRILNSFLKIFPKTNYFLLCDTYRSELNPSSKLPIFTLGFELIHSLMGHYIPSLAEWKSLFDESGWKYVKEVKTNIPFSSIFILEPKK